MALTLEKSVYSTLSRPRKRELERPKYIERGEKEIEEIGVGLVVQSRLMTQKKKLVASNGRNLFLLSMHDRRQEEEREILSCKHESIKERKRSIKMGKLR